MKKLMLLMVGVLLCGAFSAQASVIYVSGDVSGTWSADTVIVEDSVRVPPAQTLTINPGVTVLFWSYGKFIVDTTATLVAVGTANDSIRFDEYFPGNRWHGIRFKFASSSSRLEYCRLRHGLASGSGADADGGALYLNYSNITIQNCLIDSCSAIDGGGIYCNQASPTISGNTISNNSGGSSGGGIYCDSNSNPTINTNTISNNSSVWAGGIYCNNSSPPITNNIISNNSGFLYGGGIYCDNNSSPAISNNTITGNSVNYYSGGGILCTNNSSPAISNNTISNNSASNYGGGIYCLQSSPAITNNTISNNSGGSGGGGILCWANSNPTISGNTITNNSAGHGGGIYCESSNPTISGNTITDNSGSGGGGGIYCESNSSPSISNNTISNNSAPSGAGIYSNGSNPTIFKNTIGYNLATSAGGGIYCSGYTDTIRFNVIKNNTGPNGGGIYLTGSNGFVLNNTISFNSASSYGGGLYCTSSSPTVKNNILYFDSAPNGAEIWLASGSNPSVTYCDIQGVWPGGTNIHVDPRYVDYWHGFYDLQWGSPCIDKGDPAMYDPDGTRTDIGALYFHQGALVIAMAPINPPISVPAGGHFNFNGILQNLTGQQQIADVWIKLNVPGYGIYGPIMQFNNIPIAAYDTLFAPNVRQDIPSFAPLGTYTYIAYAGDNPATIVDSCYFGFVVTAPLGGDESRSFIRDWNLSGWFEGSEDISATIPGSLALQANYPNPFNAQTNIIVDIPKAGEARLEVYNLLGQKVATLIDGNIDAGHHTISWDANEYSSGIYFYKLIVGEQVFTKRMTLLK